MIIKYRLMFLCCLIALQACENKYVKNRVDSEEKIAFGWKFNDVACTAWINNEPILRISKGGYLHDWSGFPLSKGSNILSIKFDDHENSNIDWADFSVRKISESKTEEVTISSNLDMGNFVFDLNSPHSLESFVPAEVNSESTEKLKFWVIKYIKNITEKDIPTLRSMIDVGNMNAEDFCPWATEDMMIIYSAEKLSDLSVSQGKFFTLIFSSQNSHDKVNLISSRKDDLLYRLNYLLFVSSNNGDTYMKWRGGKEYIKINI